MVNRCNATPQHAQALGIPLAAEDLSLLPALSVLAIILLGNRAPAVLSSAAGQAARARARGTRDGGLRRSPARDTSIGEPSIGRRQLVELGADAHARCAVSSSSTSSWQSPPRSLDRAHLRRALRDAQGGEGRANHRHYALARRGVLARRTRSSVPRNADRLCFNGVRTEIDRVELMWMMLGRSTWLRCTVVKTGGLECRCWWSSSLCVPRPSQNFIYPSRRRGAVICLAGSGRLRCHRGRGAGARLRGPRSTRPARW